MSDEGGMLRAADESGPSLVTDGGEGRVQTHVQVAVPLHNLLLLAVIPLLALALFVGGAFVQSGISDAAGATPSATANVGPVFTAPPQGTMLPIVTPTATTAGGHRGGGHGGGAQPSPTVTPTAVPMRPTATSTAIPIPPEPTPVPTLPLGGG